MLNFLPGVLSGLIATVLLVLNLLFWVIWLLPFAIIKLAIPINKVRKPCDVVLNFICTRWASCNKISLKLLHDIDWDIRGDDKLDLNNWYMVLSNHQSWADIVILQFVLNNRIPYFRFFLKKELIWLPIFNFVWLALDYPFMKRYSKEFLEKNPHLKGKDIEITRKSCEKFKDVPVAVMNFAEGTRFTETKHVSQNSPFKHLLKPKAGGTAFVLAAMGDQLTAILDVTIAYVPERVGLWEFLCGRVKGVKVRVRHLPVTEEIMGDYFEDAVFRKSFQEWMNGVWIEKDRLMDEMTGT